MVTMSGTMERMFLAVLLAWSISIPASAEEWEAQIVASTPDGAENRLYFGQKPDADSICFAFESSGVFQLI